MHLQFQTEDDNKLYITDTKDLDWVRLENNEVVERGKLVPQGWGIYALSGKQDGLRTFGIVVYGIGQEVKILIRANVPIKNFTMPAPINRVTFEVLPSDPSQIREIIENMDQPQQPQIPEASNVDSGNPDSDSNPDGNSTDNSVENPGQEDPEPNGPIAD